jgi:hypothetical protein
MNEEEEIIKSGLKDHSKQDTMCYVGMAIIGVLIFIPPIFRVIFADSIPKSAIEEVTYMTVTCRTSFFDSEGHGVTEIVENHYRQSEILDMKVEFLYDSQNPNFQEAAVLNFEKISKSIKEFKETKEAKKVTFSIDFLENPNLTKAEELQNYTKLAPAQMNYFRQYENLGCDHESETKMEDTKKWNEEHGIETN